MSPSKSPKKKAKKGAKGGGSVKVHVEKDVTGAEEGDLSDEELEDVAGGAKKPHVRME